MRSLLATRADLERRRPAAFFRNVEKPSLRPAPVGDKSLVEGEEAGEGVAGTETSADDKELADEPSGEDEEGPEYGFDWPEKFDDELVEREETLSEREDD